MQQRLESLLFWLMILGGAAVLVPALLLPPYLEYHAQRRSNAAAAARNAELRAELTTLEMQIAFIQHDADYLERLAREEFGHVPPDVVVQPIRTPEIAAPEDVAAPEAVATAAARDHRAAGTALPLSGSGERIARLLERYPVARTFVQPQTRRPLLALGGLLVVSAIVLLGFPRRPVPRTVSA